MICSSCGTENRSGRKFCSQCGASLSVSCPNCGAANDPGDRFCGDCGREIETLPLDEPTAGRAQPVSERKLVSVLFADLVGFTSLSERRDAEEVRELLSRYFETARKLIDRYGGTVEKFIGDAVMAVWGAPIAREDDAERAVRAGLELVQAVAALGAEVGAPELAARAGVATGEAAVTIGAVGEGMVAGDLVNTAARVQTAAAPGEVFAIDATRRATEASIVYEDAGSHELKGKEEAVQLWRAVRVIAGVAGSLRSTGLESPFVGRDRELRLIKDLFHATADEGRAHLLSVTGIGGIGKSRLSWEFFKYIDGLIDVVWWHRGRCISYGDGVTYWALAEMVRMRAGIVEEEEPASAAVKLHRAVEEFIDDPEERRWVEPRLAHLLGLEDRTAHSPEDLFSGWRLFLERIADRGPVVMVFEDLQWADDALLDFLDHLLDRSRDHPLFVVTLARPELDERRAGWGSGKRAFTSLFLEPLSDEAMDQLLRGMVPGLPRDLLGRIRERAEGVPLYAVETVRMLLDRGLLAQVGSRFEPTGPIDELDVPQTLQALIAARLDGLPSDERALLQDAAVLGKTFPKPTLMMLTGLAEDRIDTLLSSLVRKELLGTQNDPRSPERGQYGFLQSLVQMVANDTLSKRDRKARHLAVADIIDQSWAGDEDEIVEVLASHYLEAYRLAPEAADAPEIRAKARETLTRAGRRAQSLAATGLARGYFERAAELADADSKGGLLELAGLMTYHAGHLDDALPTFEEAIGFFQSSGDTHGAARVSARIGELLWLQNRIDEALERTKAAFAVLADDEPDHDLALLAAQIARFAFFAGHLDEALERVEQALEIAEDLWFPDVLSEALNTKSLILGTRGRSEEGLALRKRSLEIAMDNDIPTSVIRAATNLSDEMDVRDAFDEAKEYQRIGLEFARRLGFSGAEWFLMGHVVWTHIVRGEWEEAIAMARNLPDPEEEPGVRGGADGIASVTAIALIHQGKLDEAQSLVDRWRVAEESSDVQYRSAIAGTRARLLEARGEHADAMRLATEALEAIPELGLSSSLVKVAFETGLEASLALEDAMRADQLLRIVEEAPPGRVSPSMRARALRYRARLAASTGDIDKVESGFKAAGGLFREVGMPFFLAATELEHAEWLAANDRSEEAAPLLEEARGIFERLGAAPWVERLGKVAPDLANA